MQRRDLLKMAGAGVAAAAPVAAISLPAQGQSNAAQSAGWLSVRQFGAKGDGTTLDTQAINRAIDAAAAAGGGTVLFPAGVYLSYSIHLRSKVGLYLDQGAVILAAPSPTDGPSSSAYDAAEPQGAWEPYQDFGHNHWHNSLIWGDGISDFSITGPGMIWGKGLVRGATEHGAFAKSSLGIGNKSIALKNCRNVLLRDFKILQGGWFGILATGVDNLTIDNLTIDTNRDGMDIDCCRNVRVSNCTVNSPFDDGICPKSSFALGYARATENVTITNCFVTGGYIVGSVIDGTWKPLTERRVTTGRIKMGTESNGGFRNITISNCVFESCQGFAIESEDGAQVEDITFVGITMRDIRSGPLFLRLGSRMRGPKDASVGTMRNIILSDITSSGSSQLPSILSGVPGYSIENVKISDVYLEQVGGAPAAMAALEPPEKADGYPDPHMFGDLPATGFFVRHVNNLEMSNVEIATQTADPRPAFWLNDVDGADFFRLRAPQGATPVFDLRSVKQFRSFGSRQMPDVVFDNIEQKKI